jgi:hypothetical protein
VRPSPGKRRPHSTGSAGDPRERRPTPRPVVRPAGRPNPTLQQTVGSLALRSLLARPGRGLLLRRLLSSMFGYTQECVMVRASLAFLVALGATCTASGQPPAPKGRAARIAAPVAYEDLMLVLATKDGAAAVVFGDRGDDGGVEYQFRYESADGKRKQAGKGQLFEFPLEKGGYKPEGLYIKAGPISVEWSRGGKERGWIYYVPEDVTVHLAHADNFKDRLRTIGGRIKFEDQELDLRRFLKK